MSVGIVIPTYNRRDSLAFLLQSLAGQTIQDFHVVVADDGSSDGTRQMVEHLMQETLWRDRLRWVGCGPNLGYRAGRARNVAAANLAEDCTFMVMLDSDMILNTTVMELYAQAHAQHPSAIIVGAKDWLPPLAFSEIAQLLQEGVEALRLKVPKHSPGRVEGTLVGPDLRGKQWQGSSDALHPFTPELAWTGNVGYPLQVFRELEGFDEQMRGYGEDDTELGVRAHQKGVPCLFHSAIWSLHIWHSKVDSEKMSMERQSTVDYMIRKHGPLAYLDSFCDWTYWPHYHRLRGGRLVLLDEHLWAINFRGTYRLAFPSLDWIESLGFCSGEVEHAEAFQIAHIPIAGVCYP